MDLEKVKVILKALAQKKAKNFSQFLGRIRWHNRMLRYLADFMTPLHTVVHRTLFQWTYHWGRGIQRTQNNLIPSTRRRTTHLHKTLPCVCQCFQHSIGSALMQLIAPNWYRPVYYANRRLSTVEKNYSTTEQEALAWSIVSSSFDITYSVGNSLFMSITRRSFT